MGYDFDGALKEAEKSGLVSGGDRFKIKEGANRIRLLTAPLPHQGNYQGTKNFKWLCYVLDRSDAGIKTFFMAHTIFKALRDFQKSEDYGFDEIPMPYDVTINAKGAGTKEVEYTVVPARTSVPLTKAELDAFSKKKPIKEVQQAIYEKDTEKAVNDGGHFDPDEIPV